MKKCPLAGKIPTAIEEFLSPGNQTFVQFNPLRPVFALADQRGRRAWLAGLLLALPGWAAESVRPVSFVNDVVPVLTKAGCNSGACHAKAGQGQNGFQLSLLGFEPQEDYEHLVKESHGRRVFAASPEQSLLLRKAVNRVAQGDATFVRDDRLRQIETRHQFARHRDLDFLGGLGVQEQRVHDGRHLLASQLVEHKTGEAVAFRGVRQSVTKRCRANST